MPKHVNVIWPTRKIGTYPQQYVKTTEDGKIEISFFSRQGDMGWAVQLSRHDSKMLARRINECLEETK